MSQSPAKPERLQFIDALRAYAILMMLQGHFVDMMLASEFRDRAQPVYAAWAFLRGMTAPIFFTITGIVFVFLLLRKGLPAAQNPRVSKGLRRGLQLIGIGYLLQLCFPALLVGQWYPSYVEVDVLHCIGLALISLIGLYVVAEKLRLPLPLLLGSVALIFFFLDPVLKTVDWSFLPRFFEHYFTKAHGSNFTPIPWVGYTLIGGVIGWHVGQDQGLYRTAWWPTFFLISGLLLHHYSSALLVELYTHTGVTLFRQIAYNNYLFIRLGHVFIVIAIFMWLEAIFQKFPSLLLKVGSETLTVYGVHFVALYGTWFGLGISTFLKYSLSPWPTVIGAGLFVLAHVILIRHIEAVRGFLHQRLGQPLRRGYRLLRVALLRSRQGWLKRAIFAVEKSWAQLLNWLSLPWVRARR